MKPGDGVDGRAGRIPVGDHFKALARNKYWWLTLGLNFALWTYNGMAAYIAKYVLGNSNLIAVIGLATVIPMVIGLPFAGDRKSTRLNSSHSGQSRMPSSA